MTARASRIFWLLCEAAELARYLVASLAGVLVGIALGFAAFRLSQPWVPRGGATTLAFIVLAAGYGATRRYLYRAIGRARPRRILKALYRRPNRVASWWRTIVSSAPTTPRSLSPSGRTTITRLSI